MGIMASSETLIILPNAGNIDDDQASNYNYISGINYYQRGHELLSLLQGIGAVKFDRDNKFIFANFYVNGNENKKTIYRLLGYIAEGIIVRECNNDLNTNKKWADYARRMWEFNSNSLLSSISYDELYPENPDKYIAVGTGFSSTRYGEYKWAYNPINCRDICWIHEDNDGRELLTIDDLHRVNQRFAGLQVKVSSSSSARYVTDYFKKTTYHELYPVVYFDLGEDFYTTKDKIYNLSSYEVRPQTIFSDDVNFEGYSRLSRDEILEMMLVRGKDIAPEIYEELIWHKYTLTKVINGDINLDQLMNGDILTALIIDYVSKSLEIQTPIILVSN